jgi:hypothetical protein
MAFGRLDDGDWASNGWTLELHVVSLGVMVWEGGLLDDVNDNEPLYSGYLYSPGFASKIIYECCKQWNTWIENAFEEKS